MEDIPAGSASVLSTNLGNKLLLMFKIFREAHPLTLKYVFTDEIAGDDAPEGQLPELLQTDEVNDEDLDAIFDGSGRGKIMQSKEKLVMLHNFALVSVS